MLSFESQKTWKLLNANKLDWVVYFALISLFIYKNNQPSIPTVKKGCVCLIFTGKLAVDFIAISLFPYKN